MWKETRAVELGGGPGDSASERCVTRLSEQARRRDSGDLSLKRHVVFADDPERLGQAHTVLGGIPEPAPAQEPEETVALTRRPACPRLSYEGNALGTAVRTFRLEIVLDQTAPAWLVAHDSNRKEFRGSTEERCDPPLDVGRVRRPGEEGQCGIRRGVEGIGDRNSQLQTSRFSGRRIWCEVTFATTPWSVSATRSVE